jgi:hypothetical protein
MKNIFLNLPQKQTCLPQEVYEEARFLKTRYQRFHSQKSRLGVVMEIRRFIDKHTQYTTPIKQVIWSS